jgi:hypothetical protein
MSVVVMLIILGWSAVFAMLGFYALKESGKLMKMRRRLALWLDDSLAPAINQRPQGGMVREAERIS